jgi:predicted ATPase/class 3 adenylate cyclase/DNA-binding CsgD family transcriptional regulator
VSGLPTGTVTFLFTDIEASTRLLQHLGDRYADVLTAYRRLLRAACKKNGGREVDTPGDAFFVAFSRARDACAAAVAAQRAIAAHPWPKDTVVRARMGLHTGEPLNVGTGYVGLDVHRAARICDAGHGGQILLSSTTRDLIEQDLPEGVSLRDLGPNRLTDLAHPQHLFQVVTPDLPPDFPALRTLETFPNNLPRQLTSFIGREREMAEVKRLLSSTIMLTLTGAGGSGKTRVALQVAADLLGAFVDGAWVVELAALSDAALIPQTVASALGVPEQPGRDPIAAVNDHLREKSLLLVLDNCEHLSAAYARLAAGLLRDCPDLRILATSREPLGVPGETIWRVPSLSTPDPQHLPPHETLDQYEAIRLFAERAAAVQPEFRVTSTNAPVVAKVCHRLDGMPLAIELEAARVRAISVEQIAARLDDRFRLLTVAGWTVLPRHRTLRATLDWSYELLSEPERILLGRLSVFAGGFTLDTAEAICGGDGVEASEVLDLLARLVDKSLVVFEEQGAEARYRLLETVRQYAGDKLVASGEVEAVRTRHVDTFLGLAEATEPELEGPAQMARLRRLEVEHDNLRAALEWSIERTPETGLRLAGALGIFWLDRGHFSEGRTWIKSVLDKSGDERTAPRAKALNGLGFLALREDDTHAAHRSFQESLQIYQGLGDKRGMADSLYRLGSWAGNLGDFAQAWAFYDQSLALSRELGYQQGIVYALCDLGHVCWHRGDYLPARALLEEGLALCRALGQKRRLAFGLWSLGLVAHDEGKYAEAHSLYEEGLVTGREAGDPFGTAFCLEGFAALAATQGHATRAARLLGAAESYRAAIHSPLPHSHRSDYDRPIVRIRAILSEETFAQARTAGRAMTLEEAIQYALQPEQAGPRASKWTGTGVPDRRLPPLTPREQEVAALIAQGLTNREIASRLVIAERTAEGHVQSIFNKLGFNARAQIAAWAVEHGLRAAEPR